MAFLLEGTELCNFTLHSNKSSIMYGVKRQSRSKEKIKMLGDREGKRGIGKEKSICTKRKVLMSWSSEEFFLCFFLIIGAFYSHSVNLYIHI